MVRWEYKVVCLPTIRLSLEVKLNQFGEEGWQLISLRPVDLGRSGEMVPSEPGHADFYLGVFIRPMRGSEVEA